jgi:hypothetical protein
MIDSFTEGSSKRIRGENDLHKIRYPSEREFARLLLTKNPHLIIIYEPQRFEYTFEDGKTKATLPDFLIINPRNANQPVYVEITLSKRGVLYDVKERQKEVMAKAAPHLRYVVLYYENFQKMRRKNTRLNQWMEGNLAA